MNTQQDSFLETADAIGARLCRDAIWDGTRCNWLGASMELIFKNWTLTQCTFGPDLYGGTSGIALFLAQLYQATNEKLYRMTAVGAMNQALSRLQDIKPAFSSGFYSGFTGVAYVLIRLGEIFGNQDWIDQGLQMLEERIIDDLSLQKLDVATGIAGAIPVLLSTYQRYRRDSLKSLMLVFGKHLLETAIKSDIGWSWPTLNELENQQQPNLTGFSHGVAGIAWALLELHRETSLEAFRIAAEEGFRYEQHWFSPEQENWPDLRNYQAKITGTKQALGYSTAWCHGAPGIGLSRLRAYEISGKDNYRLEAEAALRTTVKMLQQSVISQENFSLCHGIAGNAELLIYASRVLKNADYKSMAAQVGLRGDERYEKNQSPWPCGVLGGGETPNLMLGLAGIGYFYLRLYDSVANPPVVIILPTEN
ncbi:lanthionine synthetase LanC family protein [Cylindrospermum stagnale]|uniref:lanthionine synthetase LanC family protein n=1 Tax=Cylindrospermum stagnale TaxID=142864 RepID=UPI00059DFD1A|nr:lanthionine synthetase LanC family protein [Cylindrospermum stagnale]